MEFVKTLEEYHLAPHNILMARGNDIFAECYFAPFHKDFKHRMYSISKSFVAVAIGVLEEEGKLSLDDKVIDYFPEMANNENLNDFLRDQTIRDMLKMTTSHYSGVNWFYSGTKDRRECYFASAGQRHSGTIFNYDSPGSYMMNQKRNKIQNALDRQFIAFTICGT
ncbi:MAG: serine hydrolase [Lachnospiraceae bacterium]|nr:serine hydrolase [Lachnospiraceae bacterium]